MKFDFKKLLTVVRPKTRRGYIMSGVLLVLVVFAVQKFTKTDAVIEEVIAPLPHVTVKPVAEYAGGSLMSAVGTVEAVSEATLKAEAGGQVTAVYTDLGKYVAAGAILAQFDNARERAALTSAQGAYDAAVAGAQQSDSGIKGAQIGLSSAEAAYETAISNSYTTLSGITLGTIDTFFSSPNNSIPGVRVNVNPAILNADRIALRAELPALQAQLTKLSPATVEDTKLHAVAIANRLTTMIDAFSEVVKRDGTSETLAGQPLSTYTNSLLSARDAVTGVIAALDAGSRAVAAAQEALARSTQAGSGSTNSLADAQIKIALGSLRAAQAGYEKTLVRTPISGVVNSLTIKKGDYVSPMQNVALVANNNGLQVTTALTEEARATIALGQSVRLNDAATGTITAIGGAVDPATGKIAVKIAVSDVGGLINGASVIVSFADDKTPATNRKLTLPLRAIKLTATGALVFTVTADSVLEAHEVVLGPITGDMAVITSGVEATTAVISDARGRKAGEMVEVIK